MSAEVMHLPSQPDGKHFYHEAGLHTTPPSPPPASYHPSSTSSYTVDRTLVPHTIPRTSTLPTDRQQPQPTAPLPATPQLILDPDVTTTASPNGTSTATGPWRDSSHLDLETDIQLPQYVAPRFEQQQNHVDLSTPPASPAFGDEPCDDPTEVSITSDTTRSDSPLPTPTVLDDFAVQEQPSRQVDFLNHDWREEDIWSSWRHIVSQRKARYGEMSRLENASWRTWGKAKFRLSMISPEKLNWLKESDVTWLYGPLMPASSYPITSVFSDRSAQLSRSNSFVVAKKPILKKRSVSEIMLQNSISTSSLVRQAAASVQAQGRVDRKVVHDPDAVDSKMHSDTPSRDQVDYFASRSNSSSSTPCEYGERRHIRFDDRVEQCIAVECKDNGVDFENDSAGEDDPVVHGSSDSGSDDELLIRTSVRHYLKKQRPSGKGSRSNSHSGPKTIETLPATTLKYQIDSPDITGEAQHHTFGRSWSSGTLSPSPSQETLRPSNPSSNFLLPDEEEDDEEMDSDSSWSFGASNPKSSLGAAAGPSSRRDRSSGRKKRSSTPAPRDSNYEIQGMRRTGSGMFMPYDEDEDDAIAQGLFGRVSETINTARDIAHVIWNVGWRK